LNKITLPAQCSVVSRSVDDLALRLALKGDDSEQLSRTQQRLANTALAKSGQMKLVEGKDAEWILRLTYSGGKEVAALHLQTGTDFEARRYELASENATLIEDLQKIAAWQNLWRLGARQEQLTQDNRYCRVQVDLKGAGGEELEQRAEVTPGQKLELHVSNTGVAKVWVTLILLDHNYGVPVVSTQQLAPKGARQGDNSLAPIRFTVTKQSGPCGWLVIATNADSQNSPDRSYLKQSPLARLRIADIAQSKGASTPLDELLRKVACRESPRGAAVSAADAPPAVALRSWTVKSAAK
jgi:hypothetical protein